MSPRQEPDVREVGVPVTTVWTRPDAPRPGTDDAVTTAVPDIAGWVAALDAEGTAERRLGLHGRTLTQLLLGEAVEVLEEKNGWSKVVALRQPSSGHPRGYPGWVPTAHLARPVGGSIEATAVVVAPTAGAHLSDGSALELSCGTVLPVAAAEHHEVTVRLPGDRTATIPLDAVRLVKRTEQPTYEPDDLLTTARQFLGLRYLWGGTSGWGLDCSGLVHLVLRTHGVVVPRDAFDQVAAVDDVVPVGLEEVRPGDLYFFARPGEKVYHVGFATRPVGADGVRWMLHAPEGGGLIEDAPMADERLAVLVSAARVRRPDEEPRSTLEQG
jgi:gamma-D-glutamyl-L-lysine dipeptidyl-peptidase